MNQGTTERAVPPDLCPACKEGRLVVIEKLERQGLYSRHRHFKRLAKI
jgi:hypothetical protein